MATIYIGSDFKEVRLKEKNGFSFVGTPHVVLFNKQNKKYFVADNVSPLSGGGGYDVDFTAEVTSRMIPGTYTLEVYTDSTKANLLHRKEAYATAVIVAASPEQEDGTNND